MKQENKIVGLYPLTKFYLAIACAAIAFVVSAVCAYVVTNKED